MSTLFGVLRTDAGDRVIRRIDSKSKISDFAENIFSSQLTSFFNEDNTPRKERKFEPTWTKAATDEILVLDEFDDTIGFSDAIKDPISVDQFKPSTDMPSLRGIFLSLPHEPGKILFQLVDSRHIILKTKNWWMFHESVDMNTFVKNDSNGLRLDEKLTAVYENRKLFFRNFTMASRLFDLNIYLIEANTETVISFLQHPSIETPVNYADFAENLTATHKKLVTAVLAYGCLDRLTAQEIQKRALASKSKVHIELSNGKIVIPDNSDQRARVLQFMSNLIVPSYLDDLNDYEASAVRPYGV